MVSTTPSATTTPHGVAHSVVVVPADASHCSGGGCGVGDHSTIAVGSRAAYARR